MKRQGGQIGALPETLGGFMKRDNQMEETEEIDCDFQDENYFTNIEPPLPDQEDESVFAADTVAEMPRAIRVMDFDMGLADDESGWWDEYEYDCVDENGQDDGPADSEDVHTPNTDKVREKIKIFAQPAKPYNHEADSLEDNCGITRESYQQFCKGFENTVGVARKQKPFKRSLEIEAFEKLMLPYPREVAYYITQLLEDLAEFDYLRNILRRLLREPTREDTKEDSKGDTLENIECAGSA